ncbi:AAA+ ATPase domain [Macleaya cordata]|uniref:AAA+ ATPase domain n=1 Tax=Macleaya cordata TaxID=56857 RepID=A0A200R2T8_MACCD|nr:AAA+ ATPase domain [Macleaya cordata]
MYARRFKCKSRKWDSIIQPYKYLVRSNRLDSSHSQSSCRTASRGDHLSSGILIRKVLSNPLNVNTVGRFDNCWTNSTLRLYSSKGDGRNASEDKHVPVKDATNFDKGKTRREKVTADVKHCDAHARLGEQDQKEWLNNEKLSMESKKRESPFLSRRERFKREFLRKVVPWEKITVSWETFPYYINENTKNLLVECATSHLKHKKFTASYGARLTSSSGRILLQSSPGTELYRERLIRALARDLRVPLLVLDSSVLAPYDFSEQCTSESESEDDNAESGEEGTTDSEVDDENDTSNEEDWASGSEVKSDSEDDAVDVRASAEALKKLVPYSIEEFEKRVSGEPESTSESVKPETVQSQEQSKRPFQKGDRVKYVGPGTPLHNKADRVVIGKIPTSDGPKSAYTSIPARPLSSGQRGEVYEVNGDRVAVIVDNGEKKTKGGQMDEETAEEASKSSIHWIHIQDIEHDLDSEAEDWYIAVEALCEVLPSLEPLIVYFPDSYQWLSRAVPKAHRKEFVRKVEEMFEQLLGPVVLICGQNKVETGSKEKDKLTMILPNLGRLAKLPLSLKRLTDGLKGTKRPQQSEIHKLFTNVVSIHPPKEEELLRGFNKQVEEDRKIVISRSNLNELHKVLEEHELSCVELLHVNTDDVILTKQKAEKVVGWARNHYLSACILPSIKGERLNVPRESLEIAILRLKEEEMIFAKPSQSLKSLAKDEFESNFVSAVVPPGEVGVKFNDIGALEDVKNTLNELVILPMRRPELFSHGNLLRPCKGILLFGPPGTGKTLLAKALATEAGANFISITGSTLTSKWFGDAEKLTKALFSFASKLAPVIIFVDEVDSLLGARGGAFEHEATRRMRNEFMAAWDGLRSKDSQRILILGATNRPFDLDDAVIRRLPRRIYVDLPDAENRKKILRIFLAQENLESDFKYDELANATEGYSGSDLKNLCIAAAYRPVQELLQEEKKGDMDNVAPELRPLNLGDFIEAKAKVGASVAYDATSMNELRKWNDQYGEGGSRKRSPFGIGD